PQFVEAARGLGERMLREGGKDIKDRVTFAFRTVATRRPSERERELLAALYQKQLELFDKDPENAKKYLKIGERPPAADLSAAELAAATVVANTLLNLDAALTTR